MLLISLVSKRGPETQVFNKKVFSKIWQDLQSKACARVFFKKIAGVAVHTLVFRLNGLSLRAQVLGIFFLPLLIPALYYGLFQCLPDEKSLLLKKIVRVQIYKYV